MSASEVMSIFMLEKSSSFVFFRMYGLVSEEAERMPSRVIWTPNQPPAAIPAAAAKRWSAVPVPGAQGVCPAPRVLPERFIKESQLSVKMRFLVKPPRYGY